MPYTPVLATLGYVLSPTRTHVLLIHRNALEGDYHAGKYNGLGGKLEPHEDLAAGMRREIREESGLDVVEMTLRGTISWPGFGGGGEDWFGFLFLITRFMGTALTRTREGTLTWVEVDRMPALPMWEGANHFLQLVFDEDPRPFHGVMPYENGRMISWSYTRG
ncbi:MAG: 8-oxo-dGTP diphosphatase [Gammaproteobacteria bacterium]|nr:8-oxo-dGTP diphosphatase [Gammaproteobacteria bacterium]